MRLAIKRSGGLSGEVGEDWRRLTKVGGGWRRRRGWSRRSRRVGVSPHPPRLIQRSSSGLKLASTSSIEHDGSHEMYMRANFRWSTFGSRPFSSASSTPAAVALSNASEAAAAAARSGETEAWRTRALPSVGSRPTSSGPAAADPSTSARDGLRRFSLLLAVHASHSISQRLALEWCGVGWGRSVVGTVAMVAMVAMVVERG